MNISTLDFNTILRPSRRPLVARLAGATSFGDKPPAYRGVCVAPPRGRAPTERAMSAGEIAQKTTFVAQCSVCDQTHTFEADDDYWQCRGGLITQTCPHRRCIPRHRALANVLFQLYPRERVPELAIHESSPGPVGVSHWLKANCPHYVGSGYFPDRPFGEKVGDLRNENLEAQTFPDEAFDVVLHMDVMEHVFQPFQALREIRRTLRSGGVCLFTAPTYPDRIKSEQVAFLEKGGVRIVGEPEYHGNPQDKKGSLVTWRYGYDLPLRISRETGFDVEVRRWYAPRLAIMGPMTEVYILSK
ncbi:MAG: class I SAM-dependent methyltransferase [Pseudomonadota bacterium]|nr:class I SAM-dependent methyltransferase [Pseudomonadota bacterium]